MRDGNFIVSVVLKTYSSFVLEVTMRDGNLATQF